MAKKLKKVRTSPRRLIILLAIPWLAMGAVALVLIVLGVPDYVAITAGLAVSLPVTYFIGRREQGIRRTTTRASDSQKPRV